ncbi:MAG: GNAT family N-acetyltransferase [Anaerolineae bacterium]|nr:GNAT family N-acetyltransferase [Anaerolineae bacterium]
MYIWQGERVRLRAVEPEDWTIYAAWGEDSQSDRETDMLYFPRSTETKRDHVAKLSQTMPEQDVFRFQIERLDGQLVGTLNTHSCDPRVGAFSYGLGIAKDHRRQGYASEAIRLVLRYFFNELRYQKVTVHVYDFNEGSIRLHERLGFQREGCLRRLGFTDGKYFDVLVYGLLVEEFRHQP